MNGTLLSRNDKTKKESIFKTYALLLLLLSSSWAYASEPWLSHFPPFQQEVMLPEKDTFSAFDILDETLFAHEGNFVKAYHINNGDLLWESEVPDNYTAWPSFLTLSPDQSSLWVGFTSSGNTDDRIYRLEIESLDWEHKATFAANHKLVFAAEHIFVSGTNSTDWSAPASIFVLDTSGNNAHTKIIEVGGYAAGFALDASQNLYYASYFLDDNYLFSWSHEAISAAIENNAADKNDSYLSIEDAQVLSLLPDGAYDTETDEAGHIVMTINAFPDKLLAVWNGTADSEQHQLQTIASADGEWDWLTYIKTRGNIYEYTQGNDLFVHAFAQPLTRLFHESPPFVLTQNLPNIMAYEGDGALEIDLMDYFETTNGNKNELAFEITVNSEPIVVSAQIMDSKLILEFLQYGQSNISITASLGGHSLESGFVVGVLPNLSNESIAVIDFNGLSLESESYWNGSDESGGFYSEDIFFPNEYNPDWGAWQGWAYSNISDNTSSGWSNQYSAIPGGGMSENDIYAISYVGSEGSRIKTHESSHKIRGIFISNSTYTALAMKYGDDFSKKFGGESGDDPDWFKIDIQAFHQGTAKETTIEYYLADYRFDDNTQNYIIETWQWIDLSTWGEVDSLSFALSSSDVSDWGMNTPSYFALGAIVFEEDTESFITETMPQKSDYRVFPNPTVGNFEIQCPQGKDFELRMYNAFGQLVAVKQSVGGKVLSNLNNHPKGAYILQLHSSDGVDVRTLIRR